ncbi:MAG: Rrf2 family transcriptional regulator [Tissierellales bacterium]|nr:Rrf2 family transcriptional regulator [Tissierellales bacterium]
MKLSTKGRYGLMAMYQLAMAYGEGPISIKSIADEEDLSENYLEQLFSTLKKNGLVVSSRGAYGGYMLTRHPKDITVGEILRSLEGENYPADCVSSDGFECKKEDMCVTKVVLAKIKSGIDQVIDSITLQDMIEDANMVKNL